MNSSVIVIMNSFCYEILQNCSENFSGVKKSRGVAEKYEHNLVFLFLLFEIVIFYSLQK